MRAVEKRLRERVKELEKELAEVKEDREVFRKGLAHDIREAIRIHGNGHYWRMDALIQNFCQRLQKVEWFYW